MPPIPKHKDLIPTWDSGNDPLVCWHINTKIWLPTGDGPNEATHIVIASYQATSADVVRGFVKARNIELEHVVHMWKAGEVRLCLAK